MPPRKIIIDTDPGCDDVLAMLLAFAALPEEVQVLMLSVTYGNVDVESCLKNVVSMFYHIEKELAWRAASGRSRGFEALHACKPIVAAGPTRPLAEQMLMADFFHGRDGLGDISESHPHLAPVDTWASLLRHAQSRQSTAFIADELAKDDSLFTATHAPAHEEILRLLRDNEADTITIVAIGPLTNLAIAAAADPEAFLRVKEVVVMGGAVHEPGNITPKAEFNTFADSIAAARLYALTSSDPSSTMPPHPPGAAKDSLPDYPAALSRKLKVTLFPLDTTNYHLVTRKEFKDSVSTIAESPLAQWVEAWLEATYRKIESLHDGVTGDDVGLQLHDPLTIWYCMTADKPGWKFAHNQDIRVETTGQWTRGMCVTDERSRKKRPEGDTTSPPGDHGNWLRGNAGNRMSWCIDSPDRAHFGQIMLRTIFHP